MRIIRFTAAVISMPFIAAFYVTVFIGAILIFLWEKSK